MHQGSPFFPVFPILSYWVASSVIQSCCPRSPLHHPASLTSVSVVPALHLLPPSTAFWPYGIHPISILSDPRYSLTPFILQLPWSFYTLSGHTGNALPGIPKVAGSLPSGCSKSCDLEPAFPTLQYVGLKGYSPVYGGVTASQSDLPSLTPLSVAICGRLQLRAPHRGTSAALLQVVYNWPHILW